MNSNNSENDSIKLSATVQNAVDSLRINGKILSIDLARNILVTHVSDYGSPLGPDILALLENYNRIESNPKINIDKFQNLEYTSSEWQNQVKTLYFAPALKILHGRLFLIGLALIDRTLREVFESNYFLEQLLKEVPTILDLLSSEGKIVYNNYVNKA